MRRILVAAGMTGLGLIAGPVTAEAEPASETHPSQHTYRISYQDSYNEVDIRWNEANGLINVINDRDDGGIVNIGNHYHK